MPRFFGRFKPATALVKRIMKRLKPGVLALVILFLAASLLPPGPFSRASAANLAGFVVISGGPDGQIGTEDDLYATNWQNVTKGRLPDELAGALTVAVSSCSLANGQTQAPQAASITLAVDPQTAAAGTEVAVTAVVKDTAGQPMSGVTVHFATTLGTISPQNVTTDQNGVAEAILLSSQAGTATVTAEAGNLTAQQEVTFYTNEPQPLRQPVAGEIPIYTAEELAKIGLDPNYPLNGKYILMANLDLSGYSNWMPIGNDDTFFDGTFDGNGLVIKNLTINRPAANYQGLFGFVSYTGKLINVRLEKANVTGGSYTGILAGLNSGAITNSYSQGSVIGDYYVGSLVGHNFGDITGSYSTGNTRGNYSTGGLAGINAGAITSSYSASNVIGQDNTGGLVGENSGAITNSYSIGSVQGNSAVGGLVGLNTDNTVTNCYSAGNVTGNSYVGGLVGRSYYGTVTNSYWDTQTSNCSSSAGGVGRTTAQMKQQVTFSGWDFAAVWAIDEGKSYPYLRSNEQIPHPGANQ